MAFTTAITLSGKKCIHYQPRYAQAEGKANSYFCPAGPLPGRAYVLLLKSDVDLIQSDATFTLKFEQTQDAGAATSLEVGPLYWVKATHHFISQTRLLASAQ